jgi:ABC-type branched-subunit amino acid transport system substrate-binding protein
MPYSGPASAFGAVGLTMAAYLKMINEMGGIRGRTLNLISLDDGYSPPKAVEQIRRLVENDQVLFIASPLGTAAQPRNSQVSELKQSTHDICNQRSRNIR